MERAGNYMLKRSKLVQFSLFPMGFFAGEGEGGGERVLSFLSVTDQYLLSHYNITHYLANT